MCVILFYNMLVLNDLNKFLTTGEKNGSIYALCLETFVLDWGIELGLGRIFQVRFSCLVVWSNDFVDKIRVCNHRYRCLDLGFCLDFWRQTILRTLNHSKNNFYHTLGCPFGHSCFAKYFFYDKIIPSESREERVYMGWWLSHESFFYLGRPIIPFCFLSRFSIPNL